MSVMQLENSVQFLNAASLPLSFPCLAATSALAPVIVIVAFTSLHASL